jgi:hypothetical protein
MELQAAEAEAAERAEADLAEAELEAHKQSITQVVKVWTEQVQVVVEITTNQELAVREVLA